MDGHQVNVSELKAFSTFLKKYNDDLAALDGQMSKAVSKLGTTWTDKAFQPFRSHVESTLFTQHKNDREQINRAISVLNQLIQHYEQAEAIKRKLANF